jgi:hypothetical protein
MKISFFFRWYDLWIGFYWDKNSRSLYICPIPMFGIKIQIRRFHYLIWGHYYKEKPIGCTWGKSGQQDVLSEEPHATFTRYSPKKCPICKE